MKELRLHAVALSLSPQPATFRIRIYLENKHMLLARVYESRFLTYAKKDTPTVINEAFRFELEREQQYLQLVVDYWPVDDEARDDKAKRIQRKAYVFIEDLSQNNCEFKVAISKSQSITLFYEFTGISVLGKDGVSPVEKCRRITSESSFGELATVAENDPGMLELYKTTYKFVRRITPLRRLENEVGAFVAERNLKRDLWAESGY